MTKDLTITMLLGIIARLVLEFRGKAADAGEEDAISLAVDAYKELKGEDL